MVDDNKKVRRYFLTINNPFFNSNDFEEVDLKNTNLDLKEDYYNLKDLKNDDCSNFFEFKFIKILIDNKEFVVERPFFKNFDSVRDYINQLEHFKYSCGQLECGEKEKTNHIQTFIVFEIGKRFSTIKRYFPVAHIEICRGSNAECKAYCSKKETRVDNFTFEIGKFAEERSRTDIVDFLECLNNGVSNTELQTMFPMLYLKHCSNIEKLREMKRHDDLCNEYRKLDITYIYGPPRTGKTFSIANMYGQKNIHLIRVYRFGMFDNYNGQDVLVFDEFNSQIKITEMNAYLDTYAMTLPARFYDRQANYTKVYIISNLPLQSQYIEEQEHTPVIYKAFCERIKTIIRFDEKGIQHIEKCPNLLEGVKNEK